MPGVHLLPLLSAPHPPVNEMRGRCLHFTNEETEALESECLDQGPE